MRTNSADAQRPVVVSANLIVDKNTVLLVRESKPSALQRWSLPGGRLELGETLQRGAEREALEETGLTVSAGTLIGIYHCLETLEGGAAINFVFQSTVVGGEITTTAEHPEVVYVPFLELDRLVTANMIRGSHVPIALAAALAGQSWDDGAVTVVPASTPPKTM